MGDRKAKTTDERQQTWREVGWQWRRPRVLEVTGAASTIPMAAMLGGYLTEGPIVQMAAAAIMAHAVVDLASKCVRSTRR